jgi:uncharacterized protein
VRGGTPSRPDDQRETIAFLSRPSSYGAGVGRVDRIDTHASHVFLAGDYAYKLKRAVRLAYLDFSTVDRRRDACAAELRLNRRTAPQLYLNLRRIARDNDRRIGFVDDAPAIDWVVVMRRFDQELLFDALAREGRLDASLVDTLADHIAEFHAAAEPRPDCGGAAALTDIAETQHQCLAAARAAGHELGGIDELLAAWRQEIAFIAELLERRRSAGKVRICHGDLHLRNICLLDGRPTLFDCLEFSETLASIDVLYDLSFLLMDLEHRGLGGFANRVLNRYLDRTGEDDGLAAIPLFLSLRAGIRAQTAATAALAAVDPALRDAALSETRAYLDLAQSMLRRQPARLIAIGGLSGSGKSTLAAALAPELGLRPGARVLRSDVTRKLLLGADPETRLPPEAYTPDITRRVYQTLRDNAAAALAAGYTAIIDAVSLRPDERQSIAGVATKSGVSFAGLWLETDAAAMQRRIDARRGDASDATAEVLALQLEQDPGQIDWIRLDAGGGPETCLVAARGALASA